jgi:murein DD-endopeptidase MepM/ murein hydrolase activator NlpD
MRRGSCSPPVNWQWPTRGQTQPSLSDSGRKGIRILGQVRQPIRAAAAGTVSYSGTGLQGYHNLIIIQHNAAFLSVYANNHQRLVREGMRVASGQVIAEMGVDAQRQPALHFEIRCQGKAVDPVPYLPNI